MNVLKALLQDFLRESGLSDFMLVTRMTCACVLQVVFVGEEALDAGGVRKVCDTQNG